MFSAGKIFSAQRIHDWNKMGADIDGVSEIYSSSSSSSTVPDSRGSVVALSEDGKVMATLSGPASGYSISDHHGRVKVYRWTGSSWERKGGDILNSMPRGSSTIGSMCMSRDGNRIAVSEYNLDATETAGLGWGRVKVYGWNGSSWVAVGQPIVYDNEINLNYSCLSLNSAGNVIVIGSPDVDMPTSPGQYNIRAGMVRVYSLSGSTWSQRGGNITSNLAGAATGTSVSLSQDGNTMATGTLGDIGFVSVYQWSGTSWNKKGSDIQGKFNGDKFGVTVCLDGSGNTVAAGSRAEPFPGDGYASVHDWNGSSWTKRGQDITGSHDTALSLSSDGKVIATGDFIGLSGNGIARVYGWGGTSWTKRGKDFKGTFQSRTGQSVSISGDGAVVAVGNPGVSNVTDYSCGRVYAYEWSPEKPAVLFVRW